jgi:hypothetical protein
MTARHQFALARLAALTKRPVTPAVEHYAVCIWFLATTTCFLAAFVPLILAFPLALIAVQIPIYVTGLLFNNRRVNSAFLMLCGTAAALYFASQPTWIRFAAYVFLGALALNAIAFVILVLLRK